VYCSAWECGVGETMTEETLGVLFERVEEWVVHSKRTRTLKIIWHGGEPTLMPVSFYEKALGLQERLRRLYRLEIENNIQSNLLFLNKEKVEMLGRLLEFRGQKRTVGTSYDPLPGVRVVRNRDYGAEWEKATSLLQAHGLPYGIVYVVHRGSIENIEKVAEVFLEKFAGIGVRFNPLYMEGRAANDECKPLYITPKEWGEFLVKLHEIWLRHDKKTSWQPLKEMDSFHYGKDSRMTCDKSGRCGKTHLGIDTDGTVYSCGRGIDRKYSAYGNVHRNSIAEILKHPARLAMNNRSTYLENTLCSGCKWWRYCHGGCPMDAAINNDNNIFKKTNFCVSRRLFLETVYKEPVS
jgi:uncharacterized protein